jgi:hypothetical protein
MAALNDNPFAVLTAIVAPAVLTNASSVLCLGTSNRIARVVDRTRVITRELEALGADTAEYRIRVEQLSFLRLRAQLLFRALRLMYASLGGFAASALVSVIGAALAYYGYQLAFRVIAVIALVVGSAAVTGLVVGCTLMVRETRVAIRNIAEEAESALARYGPR